MSQKIVLIAALALGLLAGAINYSYMASIRGSGLTVLRVKDGKKIAAGQRVSSDLFETVTVYGDVGQLRKVVVTSGELGSFKDQPVTEPLQPGDILMLSAFRLRGDSGVRQEIGVGERALTVSVSDEARAVGYFVRPGDVVDVWGTIGGQTYLLKDHARVAAVGELYQLGSDASDAGKSKDRKFRSVTLVVSAKDVESLVHNVNAAGGKVTLSLVGAGDADAPAGPALAPVMVAKNNGLTSSKPQDAAAEPPKGR